MSYQWKPGMKAVSVETTPFMREGQVFDVVGVMTFPCGQCHALDVGLKLPQGFNYTHCDHEHKVYGTCLWTKSSLFRPLDELEATMDRLEREGCPTSLPEPVLG